MNYQRLTQGIIIILIIIGMYFISHIYDLYFIFWWIDWAQHFIGGIGIGLIMSSFFPHKPAKVLGITLAIGISWEIFERIGHVYLPMYINFGGKMDTIMDILCAILGTSLVLLITRE